LHHGENLAGVFRAVIISTHVKTTQQDTLAIKLVSKAISEVTSF
jgi:hypothetical protein